MGDSRVVFEVPTTTADVLTYRVYILPMTDSERQVKASVQWASSHIVEPKRLGTPSGLLDALYNDMPLEEAALELRKLCDAIAESAEAPAYVLSELAVVLDKQNGLDPNWTPPSACECPMCRRPEVERNPPGVECMYDNISPVGMMAASAASGVQPEGAAAPYFLTQIRGVIERSSARQMAWDRKEREEKKKFDAFRRQHGASI